MRDIEIRCRGFELTESLGDHCTRCFKKAISWGACQVRKGLVILQDINGDHGGEDKCCRAVLSLAHGPTVVVETVDRDVYRAVCLTADRARRSLRRVLQRNTCSRSHAADHNSKGTAAFAVFRRNPHRLSGRFNHK